MRIPSATLGSWLYLEAGHWNSASVQVDKVSFVCRWEIRLKHATLAVYYHVHSNWAAGEKSAIWIIDNCQKIHSFDQLLHTGL